MRGVPTPRTSLDALLGLKEALIELMWRHRGGVGTFIDHLHQAIIFFVKTIDDVGGKLRVGDGLANGGQGVRKSANMVVVVCGGLVKFLGLAKLSTKNICTAWD
jgi:hypothetical protein